MDFNPYLPELRSDPYSHYLKLRSEDPVHRSSMGIWFISRYSDAEAILRDRHLGRNFDLFLDEQMQQGPLRELYTSILLYKDPPSHTRLRSLVSGAFSGQVVDQMRPTIQQLATDLLDQAEAAGHLDVINDFGFHLPVIVICQLLGVPSADRDLFSGWSRTLSASLELVLTPGIVQRGNEAARESSAYLHELIDERRRRPGDDLLSRLIFVAENGQRLNEDEIIGTCMFLFGAGHETSMGLIGNAALSLIRHPNELRKLTLDPSLIGSAMEECLRYDSPVQIAGRVVTQEVEIGGRTLEPGEVVAVLLGAANRDPARFAKPDELDVEREGNAPLSFGGGIHYCLGAKLGRVEAEIALTALLHRFPSLQPETEDLEWRDTVVLRSLKRLPIRMSASRGIGGSISIASVSAVESKQDAFKRRGSTDDA